MRGTFGLALVQMVAHAPPTDSDSLQEDGDMCPPPATKTSDPTYTVSKPIFSVEWSRPKFTLSLFPARRVYMGLNDRRPDPQFFLLWLHDHTNTVRLLGRLYRS